MPFLRKVEANREQRIGFSAAVESQSLRAEVQSQLSLSLLISFYVQL